MYIWLALLIPALSVGILALFFSHRTKWWEFGLPFLASLLLVGAAKAIAVATMVHDTEIWNDYVVQAQYYERWNEYIHQTCSFQTCSGSGQNQVCTTHYYDCSYVANHPEHWVAVTAGKQDFSITQEKYQYFVKLFGSTPIFKDLARHYHSIDGDMYYTNWPRTVDTVEPVNTEHTYENRVQASRSVFNYERISDDTAQAEGLFAYPKLQVFNYPSVLGNCGPDTKQADRLLSVQNALLGAKKELRMWLLCAPTTDPTFGQRQEAYWVGGNKNEVVVVVGLNEQKEVSWVHPFSWTKEREPLVEIRDSIPRGEPLNPVRLASFMASQLEAKFTRRQFAEFDYLSVEPPTWAYILVFALTLGMNIGLGYFIVVNEFTEGNPTPSYRRGARRRNYR